MALASPTRGDITRPHLGNWRAGCSCGLLDGPERGRRSEAVDDFERHREFAVVLDEVRGFYGPALEELADR